MRIPLLDLKKQHEPLKERVLGALEKVIRSNAFVLGPEVEELEERVAAYCGTRHSIGLSSGTDALLVSLMALGVGPGDEIITTPYSFFATAGVIARVGATPVFVDIDAQTYNIDADAIESVITPRTKGILPVHLYGQVAAVEPILEVAERRDLWVVEDAAQAIGAQYGDGRRAGSVGDLGCFSFYPSKNLSAMGDAGMVVTNNEELADRIRLLRVHGSQRKYEHALIGGNFRLDAMQAAVLNIKMDFLDSWTKERQENARRYEELFIEADLSDRLRLPEATLEASGVTHFHVYNQYVIASSERDGLKTQLDERGVGTAIYYPIPFHLQPCFRFLGKKAGDFPRAERAAKETLALPIYSGLSEEQQRYVVASIREFYDR